MSPPGLSSNRRRAYVLYIHFCIFDDSVSPIVTTSTGPIIAEFSGLAELKMKKFGKISTLADIKVKLYESLKR